MTGPPRQRSFASFLGPHWRPAFTADQTAAQTVRFLPYPWVLLTSVGSSHASHRNGPRMLAEPTDGLVAMGNADLGAQRFDDVGHVFPSVCGLGPDDEEPGIKARLSLLVRWDHGRGPGKLKHELCAQDSRTLHLTAEPVAGSLLCR